MAMAPMGGNGDDLVPLSEINITPFVDVMLVLLIVFMVTAPLLTSAVTVNLPAAATQAPQPQDPLVITIDGGGEVWLKDEKVAADALAARLNALHGQSPDQAIYLRGDRGIAYGRLMDVMDTLQTAGFAKVSLATGPKGE
jgi:biopolymer transport protein TolR